MAKDLYGILGISKGASPEEIKAAYRKMSKEWHPDKHKGDKGAEDKFKEINEAYEVLSDSQKKQQYDQFGTTGNGAGGGGAGFGGFDFSGFNNGGGQGFSDFGDLFGNFFGGGGQRRAADINQGENREIELTITLQDVLTGVQHPVDLRRLNVCDLCKGDGAEPGTKVVKCETCGGTGEVVRTTQSFFGQIQQRGVCSKCSGSGSIPEKKCHNCSGEGRMPDTVHVTIDVPAGIDNGQTLRVRNQGDSGRRGAANGDLFVHIRVRSDARFTREGTDIRSEVGIPVIDAILGGTVDVDTVHGTSTLSIPDGTQPGQIFRIKGKGLPELGRTAHMGDHYVIVNVEVPKKLSKAEKKILEEWRDVR